jgi:CBS domain-containing protein
MEHLDTFLATAPPFDSLDPTEIRELAGRAAEHSFAYGEVALVEDGVPADGLYLICTGSMELVHDGEVIQVLEPGECFGHPSLLSGMAPAFTVRAREASTCAVFDSADARRVLGRDAGTSYVATSMRQRLTRAGHTVHGLLDVGTTPVSAIMRPPAWCEPDVAIREAARRLGEPGVSALLVELGDDQLGIVTDAELRAKVVAGDVPADAPVSEITRTPVVTVPIAQIAVEATVDMLAAGVEEVAVLGATGICGVLSAADLLGLDAESPIALRHTILGAADEDGLVRAVEHMPRLFGLLLQAGVPSRDLGRVLSLQHDAIVTRLIDFSLWRNGPAPVQWAWLDLGSAARREFTLASDQDNALAYDTPGPGEEEAADRYFARLGSDVNEGLVRCGIGVDNNGVLAGERLWRMSRSAWIRTFEECLTEPNESHLIRASVAFDFRPAAGNLKVAAALTERVRAARSHPAFMRLLARTASGYPVALNFRGQLATDKEGRLDLKSGAIIPLVNLIRFHAIANGITISNTLDRIEAVASVGGLEREHAQALAEAFEAICTIRFEHHGELIAAGQTPDNLVDPGALSSIARAELRAALAVVKRAQKPVAGWLPST